MIGLEKVDDTDISMDAIITKNLVKKYGDFTAVDNLNLSVRQGELFALLGLNGAGKTTTIKMLTCLSRPTDGDFVLLGQNVTTECDAIKKRINVSPQETAVAPNLTVKENLEFIAGIYGVNSQEARKKAAAIAKDLGLQDVLSKKAKILSGGMQRRLSITMALITEPEILFLDEPTIGLDVIARRELWETLRAKRQSF